jgi:hypothetical protein
VPMPTGSEKDPVFRWQSVPQKVVYRFEIVSPLNPQVPIVQAMTEKTRYGISRYDIERLAANTDYLWRVVAFSGGNAVAASSYRAISFSVRGGRSGGLSLSAFSVADEAGVGRAAEGGGPFPLFRVPSGGPVRVSTLLENGTNREMKNVTVQVLLDGALYDVLFYPVLAPGDVQEVFTDLEPAGARQQTLQVSAFEEGNEGAAVTIGGAIEVTAAAAGVAGVSTVRTDPLRMTGLSMGASIIRTSNLQMTGLATGASIVSTEPLQMTGLATGAAIVRTENLKMTGMASGTSIVRTEPLQMTGLSTGASLIRTDKLQMTGLATGASIVQTDKLEMTGFFLDN